MLSYAFDPNKGETPQSIAKRRQLAQAMAMQIGTPRDVGEGLTAVGKAIAARRMMNQANKAQQAGTESANTAFNSILGAFGGGAPQAPTTSQPAANVPPSGGDWLTYANQGAVRNQPLSERLVNSLNFLPEMGVSMEVFSGGQPAKGTSNARVGSVRHDNGGAADVFFYKDGRKLDWANEADLPIFQEIVRRGKDAGLTGFGAGEGYMQPGSMHLGFGNPAVWGAGGKGANAPKWLRDAYYQAPTQPGTSPRQMAQAMTQPQQQGASVQDLMKVASNPFLTPIQQQMVGTLLQDRLKRPDPMAALEQEKLRRELDMMGQVSPDKGAQLEFDRERMGSTDDTREYQFYAEAERAAGREPVPYLDFITAQKKAGAASTSVSVGGSSEYNKTLDKKFAEDFIKMQDGARSAESKIATLTALSNALDQSQYTGMGAETMLAMRQAGRALGFDVGDNLGPEETARALGNQLALMLRSPSNGAGMPGAMSDKDREFLVASVPGLTKTPEGNRQLIDYMMRVEQRSIDVARMAQEYAAQNGQIDNGFYQKLSEYSAANPLFAETEGPAASAPASPPEGVNSDIWDIMTPEERALWQN